MTISAGYWARRFFTPHPDNEHLRGSSLKYRGNHCYLNYYRSPEIATIVTDERGDRVLLLHSPVWTNTHFNYGYQVVSFPLRFYRPMDAAIAETLRVEYQEGDNFYGKPENELLTTMRDRFKDALVRTAEHPDLFRQSRERRKAAALVDSYSSFIAHFPSMREDDIWEVKERILRDTWPNEANRRLWRTYAARASAESRRVNAARREASHKQYTISVVLENDIKEWAFGQPFYALWEARYVEGGYEKLPEDLRARLAACDPMVGRGWEDILDGILRENSARTRHRHFAHIIPDPPGSVYAGTLRFQSPYRWEYWSAAIPRNAVKDILRKLKEPLPEMFAGIRGMTAEVHTVSFDNSSWCIERPRYGASWVLNPLNRDYLIEKFSELERALEENK